jgi:hypothetical protein
MGAHNGITNNCTTRLMGYNLLTSPKLLFHT